MNKKWSVFLYAMMLSFFAVIFGYIITMKMDTLIENLDSQSYDSKLHSNITEKSTLAIDYDTSLNTDGSGFTNTIVCPNIVTLSGTLAGGTTTNIATVSYFNGAQLVCSGSTSVGNLLLSYSSGGNVFSSGSYRWFDISLLPLGGTGARTGTFADGSGTYISFTASGAFSNIDLDKNSDNFKSSSMGDTMYSSGWDNDDMARKTLYGYIKKDTGWYNVFLMNTPIRKYINNNLFNTWWLSATAGNTGTGYMRFDIDNPYSMKIIEFDKNKFENTREFSVSNSILSVSFPLGGIGWLFDDMTLSGSKTGGKVFDLQNKDYAIFLSFSGNLSNSGVDFMKYKITMENQYGSGIYIVPIDDSGSGSMRYLGTDIIIDTEWDYRYKQFEVMR